MKWIKDHASSLTAVGGLIFCLLFFTIATGIMGHSIWAPAKLATLLSDVIVTALMSVGAVFIYGLGNMDISIGKQVGLYSTIMVLAGNAMGSLIPAVLLCFVIAVIIGVVNGAAGELLHMYSVVSSVVFMMVISGIITIIYSTVARIPPVNGIPPRIRATMTFISKPVPVESDADPVYPIWNNVAITRVQARKR